MDDFYAARSRTIPPLPWSNIAPPFSLSVWRTEEDYLRFRTSDDLARVAQSFDEVYDHDGWPQAEDWSVLSEDWPVA